MSNYNITGLYLMLFSHIGQVTRLQANTPSRPHSIKQKFVIESNRRIIYYFSKLSTILQMNNHFNIFLNSRPNKNLANHLHWRISLRPETDNLAYSLP